MSDLNVKDFLHVFVVSGDLEHRAGPVLDTGDVDRHYVCGNPLPSHIVAIAMDPENLRPQPEKQQNKTIKKQ